MDDPLTGEADNSIPTRRPSRTTGEQTATERTDISDTARDADIMMRMIVGSISPDPDDVRQGLKKKQRQLPSMSEKDVNIRLVILAVALIFLVFGFDLVFLKM